MNTVLRHSNVLHLHQQVCHNIGDTIVRTSRFTQAIILSSKKTLKTYRNSTTSLWNWSINDLLLEQKGKLHEFRHFHQRSAVCVLRGTLRLRERRDEDEDLGHFDNLLRNRQIDVIVVGLTEDTSVCAPTPTINWQ